MATIDLVDVSIRDGNQSLWGATGLDSNQILQIAPVIARVGFSAIDFISSSAMAVAVRYHREDPWDRIRRMHAMMPETPLQLITPCIRFISWEASDPEFMRLVYRCLMRNGIGRFVLLDPMHDMDTLIDAATMVREEGEALNMAALTYTLSEVHDDGFYANCAEQIAHSGLFDSVYIKDPSGLLSAERAATLIPAVRAKLGGLPLELHSHCTIGLSQFNYLVAADIGIDALHVGVGPLGNGSSLPPAERTIANLREHGHDVNVNEKALAAMSSYFTRLAEAEGLPAGVPLEYDAAYLRHQLPGGVMTTVKRQLKELGMPGKFPEVLQQVERVRAELGYPIMVTPMPQIVCTQALLNIIGEERYDNIPDQVIRYVVGRFGRPTNPVDPDVLDRVMSLPRTKEILAEPATIPLAETRKKFSRNISDEEFLLRAVMPAGQVDAMLANRKPPAHYNPDTRSILKLIEELSAQPAREQVVIEKAGFRLELKSSEMARKVL